MNRPERAGVTIGAVLTAAVLPVAVMPAQAPMSGPDIARPAITRPDIARPDIARPATTLLAASLPTTTMAMQPAYSHWGARAARRASVWRLAVVDHYGGPSNASGYSAVLAPGQHDAWVFGGTNPGAASRPVAEHWNGHGWRAVSLPAGLSSFISGASASAPASLWAVSSFGGYALRWDGASWSVARRWQPGAAPASIVAISPSDVWLFGVPGRGDSAGTWNYNGRSWARAAGPPILRASAVSRRDIWAITAAPDGGLVEHWDGSTWKRVPTGSVLAGTQLDDVLAVSRYGVWIVGNSPAASPAGHVVLAHWNGRKWRRIEAPGRALPRRLSADGSGGVWVTATTLGAQTQSRLLHLSRSGRWTQADIAHGLGNAVSELALIPGTSSEWGSGGFLTQSGGDAAIWLYTAAGTPPPASARGDAGQHLAAHLNPADCRCG